MPPAPFRGEEGFPVTQWSLVARAAQADVGARREALEQFLTRYLPALQAHLVRRKGIPPEKADDLVQDFITSKILERDLLARADKQLGRLRTLLLTALDRFVKNRFRDEHAKKRAPNEGALLTLDDEQGGVPCEERPSDAFDAAWGRSVIAEALRQMRAECEQSGRQDLWGLFECRVVAPILEGAPPVDYPQLVERFAFQSPTQAFNLLTTAKRMYARALRAAVAQYAGNEEEIESEIRELRNTLARCG